MNERFEGDNEFEDKKPLRFDPRGTLLLIGLICLAGVIAKACS